MDGGAVSQMRLDAHAPVSEHRVRGLAGVLAGFRWPGAGTFEKLKKGQQQAALDAARAALERLAEEPD